MPDLTISEVINKSHQNIQRYRAELGIRPFFENFAHGEVTPQKREAVQTENHRLLQEWKQRFYRRFVGTRTRIFQVMCENPSMPDQGIVLLLAQENIRVARRTINKYRHALVARGVLSA